MKERGSGADRSRQAELEAGLSRVFPPASEPGWLIEVTEPTALTTERAAGVAADFGATLVEIDGSSLRSWAQLPESLALALDFPSYYGANADAFVECLGDLLGSGVPRTQGRTEREGRWGGRRRSGTRGVVVLLVEAALQRKAARDRARFVDLIDAALDDQAGGSRPVAGFGLIVARRERAADR